MQQSQCGCLPACGEALRCVALRVIRRPSLCGRAAPKSNQLVPQESSVSVRRDPDSVLFACRQQAGRSPPSNTIRLWSSDHNNNRSRRRRSRRRGQGRGGGGGAAEGSSFLTAEEDDGAPAGQCETDPIRKKPAVTGMEAATRGRH